MLPFIKMQEGEGKAACKSDKIASTPARGHSAEVTPCPTANERVQTKAKKKKGLGGYFGTGARMLPPNLKGTPIDAVGTRRGGRTRQTIAQGRRVSAHLNPRLTGTRPNQTREGRQTEGEPRETYKAV